MMSAHATLAIQASVLGSRPHPPAPWVPSERENDRHSTDGAFMEPSRRNRGSQGQIARRPKPRKQAKLVAVACNQLPEPSNGKEGVDGSSPSEGFTKGQQMAFLLPRWRTRIA